MTLAPAAVAPPTIPTAAALLRVNPVPVAMYLVVSITVGSWWGSSPQRHQKRGGHMRSVAENNNELRFAVEQ